MKNINTDADYLSRDMMSEEELNSYLELSNEEKAIQMGIYMERWFKKYPYIQERFEDNGQRMLDALFSNGKQIKREKRRLELLEKRKEEIYAENKERFDRDGALLEEILKEYYEENTL